MSSDEDIDVEQLSFSSSDSNDDTEHNSHDSASDMETSSTRLSARDRNAPVDNVALQEDLNERTSIIARPPSSGWRKYFCCACNQQNDFVELDSADAGHDVDSHEAIVRRFFPKRLLLFTVIGATIGLILGIVFAFTRPGATFIQIVGFPGEILMRMLRALVLPLIFCSIVCAIARLSGEGTGKLAIKTLAFFSAATLLAAVLGIVMVSLIRPGSAGSLPPMPLPTSDSPDPLSGATTPLEALFDVVKDIFPDNLVKAAADMNVLGLISFAVAVGTVVPKLGDDGQPLLALISSGKSRASAAGALNSVCARAVNKLTMALIGLVLHYVPFGICSLVAAKLGEDEHLVDKLEQLGLFMLTVLAGLFVQTFVLLPLFYVCALRRNPFAFYVKMSEAFLIAFGTGSSAATIPISLKCAENAGIDRNVAAFVVPLGATVNMTGTALYESVSVIFIAQSLGMDLNAGQLVIIALTSALAAMGAASIPEAGLFTMVLVLTAVGLPVDGIALIFAVDWILDRVRTVVNVAGDLVAAAIVDGKNNR